jgi:hypothetical protein
MSENVPFIWLKNYLNESASPEKVLSTRTKRRANI